MRLLSIRIPMALPLVIVPEEDEAAVKRAALDELCALVPGLAALKSSIPGIGMQAFDSQLYLAVTLVPTPQLVLNLSPKDWGLGRVVELDPTVADQLTVKESIRLTQDLLADAGHGVPEALVDWLDRFEKVERRRATNRLRRELGRRYAISVFEQPEVVSLPEVQATTLEEESRSISMIVTDMKRNESFKAHHLQEVRDDDLPPMALDPREVWTFLRRGSSRSYAAGQRIHKSMESFQRVVVTGRLVTHVVTDSPIAMEVERVGLREYAPEDDAAQRRLP